MKPLSVAYFPNWVTWVQIYRPDILLFDDITEAMRAEFMELNW